MNILSDSIYRAFDILHAKIKENECEVKDFNNLLIDSFNSVFGNEGYNVSIKRCNIYHPAYLYYTVCLSKGIYFLDIEMSVHMIMDCPSISIIENHKFFKLFNLKFNKKISGEIVLIKSIDFNLVSFQKYEQSVDSLIKQETIKSKRIEIFECIDGDTVVDIKKTIGLLEDYNHLLSTDAI